MSLADAECNERVHLEPETRNEIHKTAYHLVSTAPPADARDLVGSLCTSLLRECSMFL
jgi:hypothetical protein